MAEDEGMPILPKSPLVEFAKPVIQLYYRAVETYHHCEVPMKEMKNSQPYSLPWAIQRVTSRPKGQQCKHEPLSLKQIVPTEIRSICLSRAWPPKVKIWGKIRVEVMLSPNQRRALAIGEDQKMVKVSISPLCSQMFSRRPQKTEKTI